MPGVWVLLGLSHGEHVLWAFYHLKRHQLSAPESSLDEKDSPFSPCLWDGGVARS